ncbi:MAG: OmpA family protein [Bacteroidota bacterium]
MKNLSILLIFCASFTYAQKEANYWYFGNKAGVDFSSGKPVALTNGALSTDEGCAVISDKNGKLLFYTDGISVWNADHMLMANGQGLKGNPSSTSSGVAIPKPNNAGMYYLFSVAATGGVEGLCYSVVDMKLNNGLGDIADSAKNVALHTPVTEKLTAVTHRNGKDIWVIAHVWNSDEFLAYLVTDKGVTKTPVVSKTGLVHQGGTLNTQGYMKSNPDGSNIALALEESYQVELFDFDNASGKLSNPITVKFADGSYPYGIEFSADGSILYVSAAGPGEIYQFNLQAGSNEAIQSSMLRIGNTPNKEWIGALQIANDGKIYFPIYNKEYLGVIHNPNTIGMGAGYENNYVQLSGRTATLGLPTFSQSFFTQEVNSKVTYFDPTKVELDKAIILKNITFDFAKHSLKSSSFTELDKVVAMLKKFPEYKITLVGHTDNIGNKSSNLTLSLNRAKSVKEYLVSKGISESRIAYEGKGSSAPVATNLTEEGRLTNRRVEFVLRK